MPPLCTNSFIMIIIIICFSASSFSLKNTRCSRTEWIKWFINEFNQWEKSIISLALCRPILRQYFTWKFRFFLVEMNGASWIYMTGFDSPDEFPDREHLVCCVVFSYFFLLILNVNYFFFFALTTATNVSGYNVWDVVQILNSTEWINN